MKDPIFVIYAPPYSPYSGGILVLHHLGELLRDLGQTVFIKSDKTIPGSKLNLWSPKVSMENAVVIYPEITQGNPLKANYVVRWVLNTPGKVKQDTQNTWGKNDLIYTYIDYFKVRDGIKVNGNLRCYNFNLSLFSNFGKERKLLAYSTRKHGDKPLNYHLLNYTNIDNKLENFKELNEVLNQTSIFLSYDTTTYYSIIACLCGATSIVVPDPGITKKEWRSKTPTLKYGVGYGFEDLEWAVSTKHLVRDYLLKLQSESITLVSNFIKDCQTLIN